MTAGWRRRRPPARSLGRLDLAVLELPCVLSQVPDVAALVLGVPGAVVLDPLALLLTTV
jgi:hypothetical protein